LRPRARSTTAGVHRRSSGAKALAGVYGVLAGVGTPHRGAPVTAEAATNSLRRGG
jgi:hypothetical protein